MKIGIFTLPLHINYGGIIQAYALQTLLQRMEHQVSVINRRPNIPHFAISLRRLPFAYTKRAAKKLLRNHHIVIRREQWMNRQMPLFYKHTDRFISQYIHSFYVNTVADIQPDDFDAIVVGSDQIWREIYNKRDFLMNNNANRFLAFADGWNIKRYAYAASFGVDNWQFNPDETQQMARLAKQFIAISVREDTAVALCKQHLRIDALHLLDPTMLLTQDDYRRLTHAANIPPSPGTLFCYILDPSEEKTQLIRRIATDRHLTPFQVAPRYPMDQNYPIELRCVPPIEKWLRAFMDAKFVVTDSFHGMAFSINFGKPFVAIGNKGRGFARMSSIARMFGIEDHVLLNTADYDHSKSYDVAPQTHNILEEQRQKSHAFLAQIK